MPLHQAENPRLPEGITKEDVLSEVARICRHPRFQRAEFLRKFLAFSVERTLENDTAALKEYSIGTYVFGRNEDFDPRNSSIVRTQASKLRSRMAEYYRSDGRNSSFVITFPAGSYVPVFTLSGAAAPQILDSGELPRHGRLRDLKSTPHTSILAILPGDCGLVRDKIAEMEGFAANLTTSLARRFPKNVLANSVASSLSRNRESLFEFGDRLTIDYLAELELHREKQSTYITVSLMSYADGTYRWVQSFPWPEDSQESLLRDMSEAITDVLKGLDDWTFDQSSKLLMHDRCEHICEEGYYGLERFTTPSVAQAERAFLRAQSVDAHVSRAYSGLALVSMSRILMGILPMEEAMSESVVLAARATALDPNSAQTLLGDATVRGLVDWDFPAAAAKFALAAHNGSASSIRLPLEVLTLRIPTGTLTEEPAELAEVIRRSPASIISRYALAMAFLHSGRPEEAEVEFRRTIELEYLCGPAWRGLWRALITQRKFEEADRVTRFVDPHTLLPYSIENLQAAAAGYQSNWQSLKGSLDTIAQFPLIERALILQAHHGVFAAISELGHAVKLHHSEAISIKTEPLLSSLRAEAGFQSLLRRFEL